MGAKQQKNSADHLVQYQERDLHKLLSSYLKNKNKAIDYEAHLQKIGLFNHRKKVKIFDPIYINSVTGCSAAWNYEFLNVIRVPKSTENVLMHDWWLYLTATYLGEFFYDENPIVYWIRHGSIRV